MDKVIKFHQDNWTLELLLRTQDWCDCVLIESEHVHKLGSESLSYIVPRLFAALCESNKPKDSDVSSYSWVLSLAEIHSSLYVAQRGDTKALLWQDADAHSIGEMILSLDDCLAWCNQLRLITNEYL